MGQGHFYIQEPISYAKLWHDISAAAPPDGEDGGGGSGGEGVGSSASNPPGGGAARSIASRHDGAEYDPEKNLVVFQRYCHMYRKGELEELAGRVDGLEVVGSSFERGNHVVTLRVVD